MDPSETEACRGARGRSPARSRGGPAVPVAAGGTWRRRTGQPAPRPPEPWRRACRCRRGTPRSKKVHIRQRGLKLEHVEDVERVIGLVHSIYPAEPRLSGECANAFLAHAGPGAHAAGRERLGHAIIDAGGIAECAKPERVLDVAGEIAEQVELGHQA